MTDNEILLALSNLLEPIREDIGEMKREIKGTNGEVQGLKVKVENLNNEVQGLKTDFRDLKCDVQDLKTDFQGMKCEVQGMKDDLREVKGRVKKIELTQENVILPRLQNIEACYTSTYEKYKNNVEDYDTMKQDVSLLKKVVAEHSEKLQRIS